MREEAKSPAAEPSASERDAITSEQRVCLYQSVITLWEHFEFPERKKSLYLFKDRSSFSDTGFFLSPPKKTAGGCGTSCGTERLLKLSFIVGNCGH